MNLFLSAAEHKLKRVVFSSSAFVWFTVQAAQGPIGGLWICQRIYVGAHIDFVNFFNKMFRWSAA